METGRWVEDQTEGTAPSPGSPAGPFAGPGEMRARCRALDWAATPLGPVDAWPSSLRTAAALVLASPTPMILLWGPELVQLYNDGYSRVMGAKHPWGLGQPNRLCWPEVWDFTGPVYEGVVQRAEAFTFGDQRLVLERHGHPEETFFSLTYTPVFDETGSVGGVFVIVVETTEQVRARNAREAERERLLAAERAAAAELRAVLESMPDAVYIGTADGITPANQGALDQLGYASREEMNRSVAALAAEIHTRDAETGEFIPAEDQAFTRALAGERVVREVIVRHRGTGEDRVVRSAAAPVVVDGRVVAAVAVNTDVTDARRAAAERERLAAEVEAERERLRSLILHMPAPVALHMGPEHRFALVNEAYKRITAGGRDATGHTPREVFPELAESGIFELLDAVYATGQPWSGPETPVRYDRDGTGLQDTWFDIRFEPVRDAAGQVAGVLNFSFDVSAQVMARRDVEAHARALAHRTVELEASQDRLRLALDAAQMAFWDFDPRANTTVRSPHHDRMYGHAEPLPVWNFDVFLAHVHPDDRARVAERFARALEHDEEWKVESRVVWPDGSEHWIATQGMVFHDPGGTPNRVLGTIADVTARKRNEAERERLLREAEAARAEAEAANRAKSEFLAVMSHELRTPLNAIGGYAEILEMGIRGPVTKEQVEDLRRVQASQRHLLGLVNEVLNYARIETGTVRYDLEDVPLVAVAASVEPLVAPQLAAKGLAFRSACHAAVVARADREKVRQVLLNLLSNAVKFTDAGGRVELACEARGNAVAVRVSDTGIGIAPDEIERVFEPFVQVNASLTRTAEGTGLGLAISRDLARGMGGDLTVESTPGGGSVFILSLPRAQHAANDVAADRSG